MSSVITQDQAQLLSAIREEVAKIRSYKPRVGVFGNSGVGKSSLCNALFGKKTAKISDVKACTREPQEIFIGSENGGITLVDVPGIGEDPARQKEYTALYKSLAPELDLILWAIKADDRNYASAIDAYKEVFSSADNLPPILFVITQTDKTNSIKDWDHEEYEPGGAQIGNIAIKENDVSRRFDVSTNKIISVAVSDPCDGKAYNLKELVELIVQVLPNEKKYSFTREAKQENVSEEARIVAEKGVWDSIKEFAGEAWDSAKEKIVEIISESLPVAIYKVADSAVKWLKGRFF